jgi:hypothetical protein
MLKMAKVSGEKDDSKYRWYVMGSDANGSVPCMGAPLAAAPAPAWAPAPPAAGDAASAAAAATADEDEDDDDEEEDEGACCCCWCGGWWCTAGCRGPPALPLLLLLLPLLLPPLLRPRGTSSSPAAVPVWRDDDDDDIGSLRLNHPVARTFQFVRATKAYTLFDLQSSSGQGKGTEPSRLKTRGLPPQN